MSPQHYVLIMAGGKGTRFWPVSKNQCPKQYLALNNEKSLLTNTLERIAPLAKKEHRFIITVEEQKKLAAENAQDLMATTGILVEPAGRNTAPCILLALAELEAKGATVNDVVAILPSDHVILNRENFVKDLEQAYQFAYLQKKIVTIGISPYFPHTGFGYIQKEKELAQNLYQVTAFKEKPAKDVAQSYVASGDYFWNAGMFVARLGTLLDEFSVHAPEQFQFYGDLKKLCQTNADKSELYKKMPANSIDYAVMEKSQNVVVIKASFDWNDLGSWDALESVNTPIKENILINPLAQKGMVYLEDAKGNIIYSEKQLLAVHGLSEFIVVSTPEVLMILPKSEAQKVKDVYQWVSSKADLDKLC